MPDAERRARLIIEAKDAVTSEAKRAGDALGGLKGKLADLNQAAGQLVKSFIGPAALVGAFKFSIDAAMEAQRVMTQTEAVIKSTGGAAGLTADQIGKMALKESQLTSIDDEVIQSGQNMLLTFTKVGAETFPRATRAMEDMAVAFAKGDTSAIDLQGTAIQLGKALSDPEKGLLALRRVGVTFSESQKDAIKSMVALNDVAGAQAIILKELEKEFGGSAEAAGNNLAGKLQKAQNAIENLGEAIGNKLIPVLGDAASAFTILMTGQEQISTALNEHQSEVRKTSASYEDYITEMRRAAAVTGQQIDAEGNLVKEGVGLARGHFEITKSNFALTESMYDAVKGAGSLTGAMEETKYALQKTGVAMGDVTQEAEALKIAEEEVKNSFDALKFTMSGIVGKEMTDFNSKQEELRAKAQELQTTISTSYGKAKDDAIASLADVNKELGANAAAHEDATKRILFDIAAQQLGMDGLTAKEVDALTILASKWGMMDQATADATKNVLKATLGLANDGSADVFALNMQNAFKTAEAGADSARQSFDRARDAAQAMAGTYNIEVFTKYTGTPLEVGPPMVGPPGPKTPTPTPKKTPTPPRPPGTRRQFGGSVAGGSSYLVGEGGMEMFVPSTAGFMMDNTDTRKMIQLLQAIAAGIGNMGQINVNAGGVDVNSIVNGLNVALGRRARQARVSGAGMIGQ